MRNIILLAFIFIACNLSAQQTGSGTDTTGQVIVDSIRVVITPIVADSIYQVIEAAYYSDGSSNVRKHAPQAKEAIIRFYKESLNLIDNQIQNADSQDRLLKDARKKLLEQRKVYRAELKKLEKDE